MPFVIKHLIRSLIVCEIFFASQFAMAADPPVDFQKEVAPTLRKYCAGCHNDADREGNFSLESFASLQTGIKNKPAVLPGDSAGSKLWRVLSGGEPQMPPEGEPAPTPAERAAIQLWIDQGAKGPAGQEPDRLKMLVPRIEPQTSLSPVTSVDCASTGNAIAIGRYGQVEIHTRNSNDAPGKWEATRILKDIPGKVEAVHFCFDGTRLITASGVSGVAGLATLWDVTSGERIRDFQGHRDILFDAEVSPDGALLATCSYDREIILWDVATGTQLRRLSGHNGAVFDIAFHPAGSVLASASADDTCKVWRVSDGVRLDTLGQPLKEQYAIEFSPDGRLILAAGADDQIRAWKLRSTQKPTISPLTLARFAHDAPIVAMAYTPDGTRLMTAAEDRSLKIWETEGFTEIQSLGQQRGVVDSIAPLPDGQHFVVGRLDGSWEVLPLPPVPTKAKQAAMASASARGSVSTSEETATAIPVELPEVEPNNTLAQAQRIALPALVKGVIHQPQAKTDVDEFRIAAKSGETWVMEVTAARAKSKLDSIIDVLTLDGEPIERARLQAIRDSYFTFRGKNGEQANDFRLFQWEEMGPNELLYCNGEVVKLWRAPIGADAGFDVYPGAGKRWGYLGTSGLTHALNEPCYIVKAYEPGTDLIPNGLPEFPIYYENDDASRREAGSDSKLFFTAPADGEYLVRIRDVRGMQGPEWTYQLAIRRPAPDFTVTLKERKPTIHSGNQVELNFDVDRHDEFDGSISVQASGLPQGFTFETPLIVEHEQITTSGVLAAAPDAPQPTADQLKEIKFVARATIDGREVLHPIAGFTELKVDPAKTYQIAIEPVAGERQPVRAEAGKPLEFEMEPGETIMLKVVLQRNGNNSIITFGRAESGRNLPFGVFVDNIGLNGLMIAADKSEQTFFLTAYDWVPEQSRTFHLQANGKNAPATPPAVLKIVRHRNEKVATP